MHLPQSFILYIPHFAPIFNIIYTFYVRLFVLLFTFQARLFVSLQDGLIQQIFQLLTFFVFCTFYTLQSVDEVKALHADMFAFYTKKMTSLDKAEVYSKPVVLCIDYIYNHLYETIRGSNTQRLWLKIFPSVPLHWQDTMEIIYIKKGRGSGAIDLCSQKYPAFYRRKFSAAPHGGGSRWCMRL